MGTGEAGAASEWKKGWPVVVAAMAGFSFFSVLLAATGLFIEPLEKEFGWDRATISIGPAIATTVTALLSPLYGAWIDRFGSRRLGIPGVLVTMLATCMFAFISGSKTQWVIMWLVFGLILTSIKSTIWTTAVAGVFTKGRGLALGLAVAGTAVAQTLVPPLGNTLIENFGWRATYVWFGLGWGGLTLILCFLFLTDAQSRTAKATKLGLKTVQAVLLPGLERKEALRNRGLLLVALSSFIVMAMTIGLSMHLFPILTEAGVTRSHAAWLLSLGGIAGVIGKLVTGALMDRYAPNWTGAVTMGITAVTFAVLIWWLDSMPALIMAMIINGYAAGSKMQITAYLTAGYAGLRNFGVIYGVMSALVSLASGLGPWIAGKIYDTSGSYEPFLLTGAVACALGGALLLALPRMPQWQAAEETA